MQNKFSYMGDFFQIFLISRSTEILIKSNFWLEIYVPYILKLNNWTISIQSFVRGSRNMATRKKNSHIASSSILLMQSAKLNFFIKHFLISPILYKRSTLINFDFLIKENF